MSVFSYSGRDPSGRRIRGFAEAETAKAARAALQSRGIVTETLSPAAFARGLGRGRRACLYGEAGALLAAGFTVEQALGLLVDESQGDDSGALLALRSRILGGEALSDAIAALSPRLPGFERAALRIAEATGAQGQMLARLSEFLEADQAVRDRIRSALAYPCTVLALALALLALVAFVILPKAAAMFPPGAAPRSAALLAKSAPVAMGAAAFLLAAAAGAVAAMAARARRGGENALRFERLLLALPLMRRLLPLLWASRFAGTMGLLLGAGLAPQSALAPAGSATGSETVASLAAAAQEDVRGGLPLSKAIARVAPVAPHLASWMGVGEKAGALGDMLAKASARARAEYEKALSRALAALEPALVAAVGAVVLLVALSVVRPMLDLTTRGL